MTAGYGSCHGGSLECPKRNKDENTISQHLWDRAKASLRRKCIATVLRVKNRPQRAAGKFRWLRHSRHASWHSRHTSWHASACGVWIPCLTVKGRGLVAPLQGQVCICFQEIVTPGDVCLHPREDGGGWAYPLPYWERAWFGSVVVFPPLQGVRKLVIDKNPAEKHKKHSWGVHSLQLRSSLKN